MKKNFLSMLVMVISLFILFNFSWAQCPEDPIDLGTCDTVYVEAWARTDTCWGGDCGVWQINNPGSLFPCFLYVNVFLTHDSNTFDAGDPYGVIQDSISSITVPLSFWHEPVGGGDADSVIFPKVTSGPNQWNNTRMDPPGHVLYSKSMFRHFADSRTGDTVYYNRFNKMVNEDFLPPWTITDDVDRDACSGDSGHMRMNLIAGASSPRWWESTKEILYTMTFIVYMDDAETTEVFFDAQFWPPGETLSCVRVDATQYNPRDNVPICFRLYDDTVEVCPEEGWIEVTSPNGGENWCAGSTEDITWNSSDVDSVMIEYTTDGGVNWLGIETSVPAVPGTYPWTIPSTPSTDCLVRICDVENGSTCDQSDAAFTISAPPAAPSNCVASDDLCDKVQFCWHDNSDDETGFYIYRDGSKLDSVVANDTCYDDDTGTAGQTYNYCVKAYNDCGESAECCDEGTILAPPAAPSDCVATDDLCDKVQFCWHDNSDDETGFYIYRDGSKLDSVVANDTCYDDDTGTPGQTYSYCVKAYNDCGESAECCDEGTRLAPPVAPSDCVATDDLCDKVQFCWHDNSDDETGFYIYRDGSKLDSVVANDTCYDDAGATAGVTYEYCVTAYNDCGESGRCCDNGTRLAPPPTPTNVTAECTDDYIHVCWDNVAGELGYYVYRNSALHDSVDADTNCYDDDNPGPGEWCYQISSYNICGASPQSDADCDSFPCEPEPIIGLDPNSFVFTAEEGGPNPDPQILLVTNEGGGLLSVTVENFKPWLVVVPDTGTAPLGVTLFVDISNLTEGTHFDTVKVSSPEAVNSPQVAEVTLRVTPAVEESLTVTSPNGGEVWCVDDTHNIAWTSSDIDTVNIEYTTDGGVSWIFVASDVPAGPGIYLWTVPNTPSTSCLVRICGEGALCDQSDSVFTILAPPATPPECSASEDSCDKVRFCWQDASDNEDGFRIYRDNVSIGSVGPDVTCFYDTTAVPGDTYKYCVAAYNDCGESGWCCDEGGLLEPPLPPTECWASDTSCYNVIFCWRDNSNDEDGFRIYRDSVCIGSVGPDVTCFDDSTAMPGVTYKYCVAAYNRCGESDWCCDEGTVLAPPAAPTDCVASDNLPDKVHFCWKDNSENEDGFIITRDAAYIASVGPNVNCFDDTTAVLGVTYLYCVRAYNWCGKSTPCCDEGSISIEVAKKICKFFLTPKKLNVGRNAEHTFMIHLKPCEPMDISKGDSAEVYVDVDSSCTFDSDERYPAVVNAPSMVIKVYCEDLVDNDPKVVIYSVNNIPISDTLGNDIVMYLDTFTPKGTKPALSPDQFTLSQNYPNPFNPETEISFSLPERTQVSLVIYNILGKQVKTLVDDYLEAGVHTTTWDGTNELGETVSNGIYFYRLVAGEEIVTNKMVLLK